MLLRWLQSLAMPRKVCCECLPRLSLRPVLGGLVHGDATAQYTKLCTVMFHQH